MYFIYFFLPYIKGVTKPLKRVLKKHEITVVNKPLKTLQQELPIPKSRPPLALQLAFISLSLSLTTWHYLQNSVQQLFLELYQWNGQIIRYKEKRTHKECKNSSRRFQNCKSCLVSWPRHWFQQRMDHWQRRFSHQVVFGILAHYNHAWCRQ